MALKDNIWILDTQNRTFHIQKHCCGRLQEFCQTSSAFSDPLDLLDHPLLQDIFFLGAPSSVLGWDFYFFAKCPLRNTLTYTVGGWQLGWFNMEITQCCQA